MKRKTLRLSPELLVDFMRNPVPPGLTAEGLPEDAKIVDARFDNLLQVVMLWIESKEFTEDGHLNVFFHRNL